MLIGEYRHTLDAKKRLSLPAKFRKVTGKHIVISKGLDQCLYLYSSAEWKKLSEKFRGLSLGQADTRGFNRFMLSGASDGDVDSLGRILVPDFLKDFAGLKDKVVLIGVNDHIELWNEKRWEIYKKRIEKKADSLAEKLGDIGAI